MTINPPPLQSPPPAGVVVMIGAPGSGKTTFTEQRFAWWQIVASDRNRLMISDDEKDQSATGDAFELLHALLLARCRRRLLTAVDATNAHREHRAPILHQARVCLLPVVAVLHYPSVDTCIDRAVARARAGGRPIDREIIRKIHAAIDPAEIVAEFDAVRIITDTSDNIYGNVAVELRDSTWLR
jgi:predicted kinase